LDEIAVYPTALSPSQVNAHWRAGVAAQACPSTPTIGYPAAVAGDSPVRYWRLSELSGQSAADYSGNCRFAAFNGGAGRAPTPLINDVGGAVTNPAPAATSVAASPDGLPGGATARTVEVWEQASSSSNAMALVTYGTNSTAQYFGFNVLPNNGLSVDGYNVNVNLTSPMALEDGNWHQLAVTYDGNLTITMFVDGQSIGSGTLTSALATAIPGEGLWIGQGADSASPFTGSVGEVSVYGSALSASRIQAHYTAGTLKGGPYTASQSSGGGLNGTCSCHGQQIRRGNATASPIDTASGNFWHVFSDISIPGRSYPLGLSRTYNSQSAANNGPIGYGWQYTYSMALGQTGNTVTITQENGSQATFTLSGSTWGPSAPRFVATLTHNGDGTWTFVRQARNTYVFNASGQLITEKDLNGYTTSLSYTSGNLSTVTDPAGRTLSVGWTGSHITTVTDGNISPSRSAQFQYNDGGGNLTDVIDVNGGHSQFTYDTNHRMTVMKDPTCYATTGCPGVQNSYDGNGRVQWQKDQLNRQTTFSYATNQTTVTDPKGNQTVDAYNLGLRVATTKGYGTAQAATWRYGYDSSTLALIAVTDPNGNATTFTVDGSGNPLTVTDPLGRQTINSYNGLNELLTSKDPNLATTTKVYNANGNLTSVSRPLTGTAQVQTTTYGYADATHAGDVTSMVDPDNKTWAYSYDAYGNRASLNDPLGNKATSVFNADSWMTSSVSPKGNVAGCGCQSTYTTTYSHDLFGDLTTVTDPLGHQTIRHYDADQNVDWFQDGDGNRTTYVYDLANEQTQIQRPDTTTLTTDYFADGTVQDQKDGKNNAILTYGYDALARVTSTTDALSNVTAYSYDATGNRLTQQDPGGNCSVTPKVGCTSLTYDVANQLKSIAYSDGVTPNVTNIVYDGDGQRTSMTDGTGTSSWVWDSLHRPTSYTNGAGAQVQYGYNLRSLVTTLTYPGSLNVTRGYDDAGRFTSVLDWQSNTTTFRYDVNSNLTTETLPSGTGVVDTFTFDAADRLGTIADTKGGNTLFAATYARDNANQLTSDSSAPSSTGSYKYTTLNQVCYAGSSATNACGSPPSGSTPYSYDAADNVTQIGTAQQILNNANELCWTATTVGACAVPPTGATTYTYDTRGNRTRATPPTGGATNLSYDQGNRLTAYGTSSTYAYNGDGLRMSKIISGNTSQFLWDVSGTLPLLLKEGSTAYVYGPGGLPLEQINNPIVLWLHHDQHGSTRLATSSSGVSQATYTFDAYGTVVASTGTLANPFQFAGEYKDAESGLLLPPSALLRPGNRAFHLCGSGRF
jgi:YD repeat-containing protein